MVADVPCADCEDVPGWMLSAKMEHECCESNC